MLRGRLKSGRFSSNSLYWIDPVQSIQKIIEIAARNVDDFMYVNFKVFRDDFWGKGRHTVGIGSNKLIGGCDEYF